MRALRAVSLALAAIGCGGRMDASPDDAAVDGASDAVATEAAPPPDASPADAVAVEAGPPVDAGFTPASLGNLVLWLDASRYVSVQGGVVVAWGDGSPYENDAGAATKYAPSLVASGIGGRPSIHFDASSAVARYLIVADSPSLEWGTGDYLVAVVARYTNDPSGGVATGAASFFWKSTFQGQSGAGLAMWGNVPVADGTIEDGLLALEDVSHYAYATDGYHDGVARLYVARRVAGTLELRVDGKVVATDAESQAVDVSAPSVPVSIGAVSFAYYRLLGDVAEIDALSGPTSPDDVASLEAYLESRYGLL